MKIWFDTLPASQLPHSSDDDVDGDCDCDCIPDNARVRTLSTRVAFPFAEDDFHDVYTFMLEQATPFFMQECAEARWIACNLTESGHIVVLDQEAKSLFEQFRTPRALPEILSAIAIEKQESITAAVILLYKSGLLHNRSSPLSLYSTEESALLSAWLHVTNICNLRCHYCYLGKNSEYMAEDTAFRSVDAVFRSAIKHHFKYVKLKYAGGEASLHMMSVMAIHDYAAQLAQKQSIKLSASLLSNGVALSQHAIDNLKTRNISVTISLDGIGQYHDSQRPFIHGQGSFKFVDRTINRLLASGLVPHINVVISRRNLDGLPDLLIYILERRLSFRLSYYRDNECTSNRNELQFEEQQMIAAMRAAFRVIERNLPERRLLNALIDKSSLQSLHERTCGVGQNYLVIDQHGGITKCHTDIKSTLTTIHVDDPLQIVRDDRKGIQNLVVDEKEGCRSCSWRYWCTGGCPLLTYKMTGRFDIKSPNCNIYQALFPDALRLEGLRLLKYRTPTTL